MSDLATPPTSDFATTLDVSITTHPGIQTPLGTQPHFPSSSRFATSSAGLATLSAGLATPHQSNWGMSIFSGQPVGAPAESAGANPFASLVPGSFTNFLNGDDPFTMFNSWNDPFLVSSLGQSGVGSLSGTNIPTSMSPTGAISGEGLGLGQTQSMSMGLGGGIPTSGLPTSGFEFDQFGMFGDPNPSARNQLNLNGITAMVGSESSASQSMNEHDYSSPPTLLVQLVASPSLLPEPLSDITTSVQQLPVLPPTEPGATDLQLNRLFTSADDNDAATSLVGRSKRKQVPSLRAQRDNAIGRENHAPLPALDVTVNVKSRGRKCWNQQSRAQPRRRTDQITGTHAARTRYTLAYVLSIVDTQLHHSMSTLTIFAYLMIRQSCTRIFVSPFRTIHFFSYIRSLFFVEHLSPLFTTTEVSYLAFSLPTRANLYIVLFLDR
ncbi:hypothetical protein EV363DRAFT_1259189 [Boletus edulis]|nr:hypothetical protein EV363DRAFT_1259189 [Boletus edulis]